LLFEMLTGKPPFHGRGQEELYHNILRQKMQWPAEMSAEAKDLIGKLLNPIPEQRLNLEEIENHPWFESIAPKIIRTGPKSLMSSIASASTTAPGSFVGEVPGCPRIKANRPINLQRWRKPAGKLELEPCRRETIVNRPSTLKVFTEEQKVTPPPRTPVQRKREALGVAPKLAQAQGEAEEPELWLEAADSDVDQSDTEENAEINELTRSIANYSSCFNRRAGVTNIS